MPLCHDAVGRDGALSARRGAKRAFLDRQFAAEFAHDGIHYPTCERNIIERDGVPVGRLWVDEWRD